MSTRKVRLTLLVFTLPILLAALLWPLARTAAASTPAPSTGPFISTENPASFIGAAQAGCPSTVVVTSTNDSGSGTLRQALADVCTGGTVSFAAGLANQTITLTSAELSIAKTVTITNPNAANLNVSGNGEWRVFNIEVGAVVTISNLSIIRGMADYGGGVSNSGSLMISNSILIGNLGWQGGGIFNNGVLTVTNTAINDNSADYSGGGIQNYNTITIKSSTISSNSVHGWGGGIRNESGTATIDSSTLSDNEGTGIDNYFGTLIVNNTTLSGNKSGGPGGIGNYQGTITVNNSTFSGNIGGYNYGSGIDSIGDRSVLNLRNNIMADSGATDCDNALGYIAINLNNLIEDGSCNDNAIGFITGDPNLGPLQDNGGPTPTHALLPGSPAIDAGDNATCLATDQRNFPRPLDGNGDGTATCDIGAFEALDPSTSVIQFTQPAYTASEGIGLSQSVILTRTGNLNNSSQVQVNLNGGTATPGVDFSTTFPLTLTFGSGVASQTVPITLVNDSLVEPTETISLTVTGLSNAIIGAQNSAVLQIEDNDPEGSPPVGVYLPIVIKQ